MTKAIYPATFDPIHFGHIDIAKRAAAIFDGLIVAVYDQPMKNLLFSIDERMSLVERALSNIPKLSIVRYGGLTVEYTRQIGAQVIVRGLRVFSDFEFEFRMALANQRLATDIETVALITAEQHTFLSSSTVREIAMLNGDVSSMVPPYVEKALKQKLAEMAEHQSPPNALRD